MQKQCRRLRLLDEQSQTLILHLSNAIPVSHIAFEKYEKYFDPAMNTYLTSQPPIGITRCQSSRHWQRVISQVSYVFDGSNRNLLGPDPGRTVHRANMILSF